MRYAIRLLLTLVIAAAPVAAFAHGPAARPPTLGERVAALEGRLAEAEAREAALRSALAAVVAGLAAEASARQAADGRIEASVDPLLRYIRIELDDIGGLPGPHVVVTGANVHVRSGTGLTDDGGEPVGLGNLVLGYNEPADGDEPPTRSGSHNLVVGSGRSFTGIGGLVAGEAEGDPPGMGPGDAAPDGGVGADAGQMLDAAGEPLADGP
jgi:hypothetical protein